MFCLPHYIYNTTCHFIFSEGSSSICLAISVVNKSNVDHRILKKHLQFELRFKGKCKLNRLIIFQVLKFRARLHKHFLTHFLTVYTECWQTVVGFFFNYADNFVECLYLSGYSNLYGKLWWWTVPMLVWEKTTIKQEYRQSL